MNVRFEELSAPQRAGGIDVAATELCEHLLSAGVHVTLSSTSGEAKHAAYRAADLFVLPSHTENFGMVIGEAMAHALPVLTTQGTPWEILERESCGWWAPVSVEGLASALVDATNRSPVELRGMGRRGRELVQTKFTWEKAAADMKSVYEWVLSRGGKPECLITE